MTDDEIYVLFWEAIDTFPAKDRKAAKKWLDKREVAHQVVQNILGKGWASFDGDSK